MPSTTYDKAFLSDAAAPKPKRIVICCDGTWQSAVSLDPAQGCESNVARISRVLASAGTDQKMNVWQQIVYYDAGVGTGDINGFEKKRQGGEGFGLVENVIEAYNFIVNNYSPGDELFFFGFSRGAFTVRSAAGIVGQIGVVKQSFMPDFIAFYSTYIKLDAEKRPKSFDLYQDWINFTKANDVFNTPCDQVTTQVVGVWDTVGGLGIPDMGHIKTWDMSSKRAKYQFHDTELNDRIRHAYQALALDEQRVAFRPAIWKLTPENKVTKLVQCWFPGAHINVGGGSSHNAGKNPIGDREQLASISYAWMLDRVAPWLAIDPSSLKSQMKAFQELADAPLRELDGPNKRTWGQWAKSWIFPAVPDRVFTAMGYAAGELKDSHGLVYDVMGDPEDRTPNRYHDWQNKTGRGEYTVERIHPSVHYRQLALKHMNVGEYVPHAMKGWERIYTEGLGKDKKPRTGWQWVKWADKAKTVKENYLWEFEIGHMPQDRSVEKMLVDGSWVQKVHDEVMESWKMV